MAAEGRNCGALGDIGNLVTVHRIDGKLLLQVSRPVIWSFCAQLLANARAAAAENNKFNFHLFSFSPPRNWRN